MRKLCADFHTHTTYCDGKSTPRQMVEAAYSMGLTDFGISGHADYSMWEPGFGMSDAILSAYKQELEILREEYAGKMNIYIGIELDTLGPVQQAEYAIGSTHSVLKDGHLVTVDDTEEKLVQAVETLWNGDWYAMARDYFELEATVYDKLHCDWVGHFDLLTKFNEGYKHFDETKDAYLEPALAALAAQNGSEEEIKELEYILKELEGLIRDKKDYSEKDSQFHAQIATCSHNRVMTNLIPVITEGVRVFADSVEETEYEQTLLSHRRIFEAIRDGRGEDARQEMYFHLMYNHNRYRKE